jgi:hypothetical protein
MCNLGNALSIAGLYAFTLVGVEIIRSALSLISRRNEDRFPQE